MSVCEDSEDEEETCVEPRRRATVDVVIDRKMYIAHVLSTLGHKTMQEVKELTEENPIFDRKMCLAHFLLALVHMITQQVRELEDVQNMET